MTDITPDKVKNLLESVINSSTEAWRAQSDYFDDLIKRHAASFAALSDARIENFKAIGESQTFNQAFEANIAYEQIVRKTLEKMQEDDAQAWDDLQQKMSAVYLAADNDEDATSA